MDAGKKILLDLLTGSLRFHSAGVSAQILMGRGAVPAAVVRHRNGRPAS